MTSAINASLTVKTLPLEAKLRLIDEFLQGSDFTPEAVSIQEQHCYGNLLMHKVFTLMAMGKQMECNDFYNASVSPYYKSFLQRARDNGCTGM